jgi:MarR family transcriptional regulator for hemolysin
MNPDTLQMHITGGVVAASRQWRRVCQTTLMNVGVTEACAGPLLMIARLGEGVRQVTVAQACGLESPSLVRLLDQLGKAGLVQRTEDPTDRRAKSLSLTDEGRALANSIEEELIRLRRDIFSHIDPADLDATLRVFKAIALATPTAPEASS